MLYDIVDDEDAIQESHLIRLERQRAIRRLLFREMQAWHDSERVILHYRLMRDDNDRVSIRDVAEHLGCACWHVVQIQTELTERLRTLLRPFVTDEPLCLTSS